MYIELTKEQANQVTNKEEISLWDTMEGARSIYQEKSNVYIGYRESNPSHALATPIKVFLIKEDF